MKRIIYIIAIIITVIAIFTLPVHALESEETQTDTEQTVTTGGEDHAAEDVTPDATDTSYLTDENTNANPSDEGANVFGAAFDFIMENRSAVLSALSFISALYLAFAYRRTLLPTVSDMLSKIKSGTEEIRKSGDKRDEELASAYTSFIEKAEAYEKNSDELKAALDRIADMKNAQVKIESALLSELDMLYEVFMAASLPQYEKDRVGEKFAAIKKAVGAGDVTDD